MAMPLVRPPCQCLDGGRRAHDGRVSGAGQVLDVIEEESEVLVGEEDDLFADAGREQDGEGLPDMDDGFIVDSGKRVPLEAPGDAEDPECEPRRALPDPGQPTQEEFEEHCIDHANYRSWCKFCVQARGRGEPHRHGRQCGRGRRVPCFQFDYLFATKNGKILSREELLADDSEELSLKFLVAKDSWTKAIFAHVVDKKGVDEQNYIIDRLMEDLKWLGFSRVSLRSDHEPAIVQVLKRALITARVEVLDDEGKPPEQVTEEHPARYDSKSAGDIEVAVRDVKGLLTANKLCLEDRIKRRIPTDHVLLTWLVEFVAWVLTTRRRGEDGLTAYQRARGRDYVKRQLGFAEVVLHKLPRKGPRVPADLEGGWQLGVILGYGNVSSEYWVFSDGKPSSAGT